MTPLTANLFAQSTIPPNMSRETANEKTTINYHPVRIVFFKLPEYL